MDNSIDLHLVWPGGKHVGESVDCDMPYLDWVLKSRNSDYLASYKWQDFLDDYFDDLKRIRVQGCLGDSADFNFTLSDSQAMSAQFIADGLSGCGDIGRLSGGAGYGKSFVMKQVVKDALNRGILPYLTAPSRVAADNLAEGLTEFNGLRIGTIAAMLGLDKVYAGAAVDYIWCDRSEEALAHVLGEGKLFIVDEFSMVNDEIGAHMIRGANQYGGQLLVVGDEKQLQPVGQNTRSVLCNVEPYTELTVPMRYGINSDLYAVEQMARANPFLVDWQRFVSSDEVRMGSTVDHMVGSVIAEPDDVTVSLHYLTRNVVHMNQMVRRGLYGDSPRLVEEAEGLRIVNTGDYACVHQMHDGVNWGQPVTGEIVPMRVYSGKMFYVQRVHEGRYMHVLQTGDVIPVVRADVIINGMDATVNLLFAKNDSQIDQSFVESVEFARVLGRMRDWAAAGEKKDDRWATFHRFKDSFIWCQYSYAMSIHRAQGMTADNVFFNIGELAGMDAGLSRDGLAYVALTRAQKSLNLIGG